LAQQPRNPAARNQSESQHKPTRSLTDIVTPDGQPNPATIPAKKSKGQQKPRRKPPHPPADIATDNSQLDRNTALLQEAVDNPGTIQIVEREICTPPVPVLSIPPATLSPELGDNGQPLELDPAVMGAALDRPGPHTWVQVFPDRILRTVLLAYRPRRNGPPDFHYLLPSLQRGLEKDLKQVRVYLLWDASGAGEPFLWIVPESEFSPYHTAMMRVLAKGDAYLKNYLVRFAGLDEGKRTCDIRYRLREPDDPLPILPSRPIEVLLPEALKQERLITSPSHPVYITLTKGGR
jgi:hypothetical protein